MTKAKIKKLKRKAKNKAKTEYREKTKHTDFHSLAVAIENIEVNFVRYLFNENNTFDDLKERIDYNINKICDDISFSKELLHKIKSCYTMSKKSFDLCVKKFKELDIYLDSENSHDKTLKDVERLENSREKEEVKICNVPDKDFDFISFLTVFSQYISEKIDMCDKYLGKKEKRYLKIFSGKLNNLTEEILQEVRI